MKVLCDVGPINQAFARMQGACVGKLLEAKSLAIDSMERRRLLRSNHPSYCPQAEPFKLAQTGVTEDRETFRQVRCPCVKSTEC